MRTFIDRLPFAQCTPEVAVEAGAFAKRLKKLSVFHAGRVERLATRTARRPIMSVKPAAAARSIGCARSSDGA
jgi:hypothetical protein